MQEKSIIKKNILDFIDYKGISKYKFYQLTGITRGVLDQNNGMSEENTARFIVHYPEINPEWLLTGKGNMLKKSENDERIMYNDNDPVALGKKREILNDQNDYIVITSNDNKEKALNFNHNDPDALAKKRKELNNQDDYIIVSTSKNKKSEYDDSLTKMKNMHLEDKVNMQDTIIDLLKKENDFLKIENDFLKTENKFLKREIDSLEKQ